MDQILLDGSGTPTSLSDLDIVRSDHMDVQSVGLRCGFILHIAHLVPATETGLGSSLDSSLSIPSYVL